jgi:hypothetical protein
MENQNVNQNKQPQGWRGVNITPDMPLGAIVHFANILNQRLCNLEELTLVDGPNGEKISITEAYALQAQVEAEQRAQQEQKGE